MSMSISSGSGFNTSQLAANLFSRLDSKQQGYLEETDFSSAVSSTSDTSSASLFTTLDSDADGKVTESEFSTGIQKLVDTLQGQLQQSRMGGMDQMPPPPPPPSEGVDEGFTQEELVAQASDSSMDSGRAALMTKIADNFAAADTDGNGKVNIEEAMAYDQANPTTDASETEVAGSTDAVTENLQLAAQLMQLLEAYGASVSDTGTTSEVSVAA